MPVDIVADYATRLHSAAWYIRRLPHDLSAALFVRETGPDLLGVAVQGRRRAIGLNAAIIGTPLELPVLAHECGHLLLGHDLGFCSSSIKAHWREERAAWDCAAVLAIPSEAAIAFASRRATVHDLADYYEVPPAMVYMRGALAVLLGETDGQREWARQQLASSRRALDAWMRHQARGM